MESGESLFFDLDNPQLLDIYPFTSNASTLPQQSSGLEAMCLNSAAINTGTSTSQTNNNPQDFEPEQRATNLLSTNNFFMGESQQMVSTCRDIPDVTATACLNLNSKFRARHVNFLTLQIGTFRYTCSSKDMKISRVKFHFYKKRVQIQFRSFGTDEQTALIDIPFDLIVGLYCSDHDFVLEVNDAPNCYVGMSEMVSRRSVIRFNRNETVDVTGGEIFTSPYYEIKFRTSNAGVIYDLLREIEPRFAQLAASPFHLDPQKLLTPLPCRPSSRKSSGAASRSSPVQKKRRISEGESITFPMSSSPEEPPCSCSISCSVDCVCCRSCKPCDSDCECSSLCCCATVTGTPGDIKSTATCTNPWTALSDTGTNLKSANSDTCLLKNISTYTADTLHALLDRLANLPCCNISLPLKRCIPNSIACPNFTQCGKRYVFSWCFGELREISVSPSLHCAECETCHNDGQHHCKDCFKLHNGPENGRCPACESPEPTAEISTNASSLSDVPYLSNSKTTISPLPMCQPVPYPTQQPLPTSFTNTCAGIPNQQTVRNSFGLPPPMPFQSVTPDGKLLVPMFRPDTTIPPRFPPYPITCMQPMPVIFVPRVPAGRFPSLAAPVIQMFPSPAAAACVYPPQLPILPLPPGFPSQTGSQSTFVPSPAPGYCFPNSGFMSSPPFPLMSTSSSMNVPNSSLQIPTPGVQSTCHPNFEFNNPPFLHGDRSLNHPGAMIETPPADNSSIPFAPNDYGYNGNPGEITRQNIDFQSNNELSRPCFPQIQCVSPYNEMNYSSYNNAAQTPFERESPVDSDANITSVESYLSSLQRPCSQFQLQASTANFGTGTSSSPIVIDSPRDSPDNNLECACLAKSTDIKDNMLDVPYQENVVKKDIKEDENETLNMIISDGQTTCIKPVTTADDKPSVSLNCKSVAESAPKVVSPDLSISGLISESFSVIDTRPDETVEYADSANY